MASVNSVQCAAKKLLERDVSTQINRVHSLTDRLFSLWSGKMYGSGFEL